MIFGCCSLFSFLLFLSSIHERWCQLGQPPFLLLLSCLWASPTAPTSFPCILSFQFLMDGCCPHTGGIRPTLLPKTLGSGSNHHFSTVYPGRKQGPAVRFPSSCCPGGGQLSFVQPPHSGGRSAPPRASWRLCQSISAPGLWNHYNLLKTLPVPNSNVKKNPSLIGFS